MSREKVIFFFIISLWSYYQPGPFKRPLKGNQTIGSEVRTPGMFSAIDIRTPAKLIVNVQRMPKVELRIDTNLMNQLRTEIVGETLRIYASRWIDPSLDPVIYVDVPMLNAITTSGYGDYVIEGINNERFEVNHGVGRLKITGTSDELTVSQGKGQLDAAELLVKRATIEIDSWGKTHVHVTEYLTASFRGRGTLIYDGNPQVSVDGEEGSIFSKNHREHPSLVATPDSIPLRLFNNRLSRTNLQVEGPTNKPFGYGFQMGPFFHKSESFPLGTRIYRVVDGAEKTLLHEVSEADRGLSIKLFKKTAARP